MSDQPARFLIAEDNEDLAGLLRRRVESEPGWTVVGMIDDANDVIPRTLEVCPDVLLLDLRMPGRDCIGVIEELKTRAPRLRVIVLSAQDATEVATRVLDAGAWGFISKFAEVPALIGAIRTVLSGRIAVERGAV